MLSPSDDVRLQRRGNALLELVKGRWREFRREPSAFFFVLLMPVVWMLLLGFAFGGKSYDLYRVGWHQSDDRPLAEVAARTALMTDGRVNLVFGTDDELAGSLRRGDVLMLVDVDADGKAHYVYDPANRESRLARGVVDDIIQRAGGRQDPVVVTDRPSSIAGTRYVDFLVPGLLAMTILSTSLFGTGMALVANRRDGLLKRYVATPLHPYKYILSHVIGRSLILALEMVTVLAAARLIFHFEVAGSLLDLVLVSVLGAATMTSLAVLLGSRTTNVAAMNGLTNLLMLPMVILGGIWFARTNLPGWVAEAARWLPLTPLVDALRSIALEGTPLVALRFELGLLAAMFLAFTVAARALFKWY